MGLGLGVWVAGVAGTEARPPWKMALLRSLTLLGTGLTRGAQRSPDLENVGRDWTPRTRD